MFSRVKRRFLLLPVVCLIGAAGLAAAVSASAHSSHAVTHEHALHARPEAKKSVLITLHHFQFNPMVETITPGTTVTWKWEDGLHGVHNLTPLKQKGGRLFKGASDRHSGTYSVKFTKPGTYYYECSIHPLSMQAKIVVK